ncbi:hypothetical protein GN958_ATG11405 [Phytophthora infestans]|uniref:Uncharacterized protein n=1 Tax=Phytophthora infestans TaxID=4787 RepID=A0A8S9UKH2_PHYIN|nr:hypothetical protein GN958_ATG11405 [Phytophthora infestans]
MVQLSVVGGGCWRKEDGWPWLRIRVQDNEDPYAPIQVTGSESNEGVTVSSGRSNKGNLVLDKCLLRKGKGNWKKELQVDLRGHKSGIISLELWVGESQATDFLQYIIGWSVDLEQWIQSGAAKRWYKIQKNSRHSSSIMANQPKYWKSEAELPSLSTHLCVGITGAEDPSDESPDAETPMVANAAPPQKSPFQFVLPHHSITRSGKLRTVRVGQIVHELRTDTLRDLVPLTLYGRTSTSHQRSSTARSEEPKDGITKALVLLQLSCQYASYCVDELNRYSSKLQRRSLNLKHKSSRSEHRQKLLKERKAKLRRETEVLSCSLDGMHALLEELDPQTLARLQAERSLNGEDIKDAEA